MKRATRLLDVTRIEAGKIQLEPRATDLSNLVVSIAQRYEANAAHKGCVLEADINAGVTAVCDPLAVEQVIENLLSNALKFGAGKPVHLGLRSDAHSACFEVHDRGIGMSEDQQECAFGRFEQVVGNNQSTGGFGLGLWISCRLVEAMNGKLTVSSRLGDGSTFKVMLPLGPANYGSATT